MERCPDREYEMYREMKAEEEERKKQEEQTRKLKVIAKSNIVKNIYKKHQ